MLPAAVAVADAALATSLASTGHVAAAVGPAAAAYQASNERALALADYVSLLPPQYQSLCEQTLGSSVSWQAHMQMRMGMCMCMCMYMCMHMCTVPVRADPWVERVLAGGTHMCMCMHIVHGNSTCT